MSPRTDSQPGPLPPEEARKPVPHRSSRAQLQHDGSHWLLSAERDEQADKPPPGIVPALEKGIAIVSYLNQIAPRAASLAEISAQLSISKSHCHSLLKTLCYFDWLIFNEEGKTYTLRWGLLSDASSLLNSPIIATIRPLLSELVAKVSVPCILSEPMADDSFVVIERFNAHHLMEISFPIGHRFPRNACAQMRAFLAWQPESRTDTWFETWTPTHYTDRTLLDEAAIREEIRATRRRGYSRSVGEFTEGLMALGLPIFDRNGNVAYLINCSSLIGTLEPIEQEVARQMQLTVARIHRVIAARVPPDFPSF